MSEQLWVESKIDREWLEWYGESCRILEIYKTEKTALIKRINTLKSVDYSKDRVTNGASQHVSEEERFTLRLEKINGLIAECEKILLPAKERLKQQISRIKRAEYRKILILRYVERWKWSDIIQECFWYEEDFDKSDYTKYKDKVLYWNRASLKALEDLSDKPFIPANQLHIGVQL